MGWSAGITKLTINDTIAQDLFAHSGGVVWIKNTGANDAYIVTTNTVPIDVSGAYLLEPGDFVVVQAGENGASFYANTNATGVTTELTVIARS